MNNQAPSRRASNHSISVQSTSLLSRALAVGSRAPSFLLRIIAVSERDGKRGVTGKKGVGTSKDKKRVGDERTRSRGGLGCAPAIIVAFPTDKVTALEYFLFPAADRARITRKES